MIIKFLAIEIFAGLALLATNLGISQTVASPAGEAYRYANTDHRATLLERADLTSQAPSITRVSISPDNIVAGQFATLTIELDRPAPPGGFVVGISHITNTGVDDTIVNMPVSVTFDGGVQSFPYRMNTQRKVDAPTDIIFTAFHYENRRSARLVVR